METSSPVGAVRLLWHARQSLDVRNIADVGCEDLAETGGPIATIIVQSHPETGSAIQAPSRRGGTDLRSAPAIEEASLVPVPEEICQELHVTPFALVDG